MSSEGGCLAGCGVVREAREGVVFTEPRPFLAVLRDEGVDILLLVALFCYQRRRE